MPIDQLVRDQNFFQDKINQDDKLIYAADFDGQFNEIATYLNDVVKPAIDALIIGAIEGVAGSAGALLRNIGDGTTDWSYIADATLDNYSIAFNKFINITPNAILAADGAGLVAQLAAPLANQVLVSRLGNTAEWRLLNGGDIPNNSIDGNQIAERTLTMDNFIPGTIVNAVANGGVTSLMMNDNVLSTAKALNGGITDAAIGKLDDRAVQGAYSNFKVSAAQTREAELTAGNLADQTVRAYHFSTAKPLDNLAIFAKWWLTDKHFIKWIGNSNYQYSGIKTITYDMINPYYFKIDWYHAYEYGTSNNAGKLGYQGYDMNLININVYNALTTKGVIDSDWS